ncbi:MAG: DUF1800 domain-containing protein [Trueperaceae bacterium]|nr:DUF1800 domain-containing protein [Trueperaceae bacterium]
MHFDPSSSVSAERHLANRLTWGARPEDIARVKQLGVAGYVEWQLDHSSIPDPLVDDFLDQNPALTADIDGIRRALDEDYGRVVQQVLWGRLYRAAFSERQLYEKMVEFWTDHFNVPLPDIVPEKIIDDRQVARAHALGRFHDLLLASARSPGMLIYLNNASSHKDHPNQNYSRELLELHTLGVQGGYTQQDVIEVARCFTGWTLSEGWRGHMVFDRNMHDEGEKVVLGHRIAAGRGIEDGLQALDILATHPSTARFVSTKLCRRFVADEPPESLVSSVAATYSATDGDLKAVLRTLFSSDEFMAARGTKFRRPMESMAAMLRALRPSISVTEPWLVNYSLERLGHLPYHWFPPNGYPDVAEPWFNVNGLLHRWNAAMVLAHTHHGWTDGAVTVDLDQVIPNATTVVALIDATWERLVGDPIEDATRSKLLAALDKPAPLDRVSPEFRNDRLPSLVGLILASPEFQLT